MTSGIINVLKNYVWARNFMNFSFIFFLAISFAEHLCLKQKYGINFENWQAPTLLNKTQVATESEY